MASRRFNMFLWLIVSVQILLVSQVDAACDDLTNYQVVANINETSPKGSILFNITLDPGENVTFTVLSTEVLDNAEALKKLKTYFVLDVQPGYFVLSLNASLDLEFFKKETEFNGAILTTIKLKFMCSTGSAYDVGIINKAVNEFSPTFIGAPFNTTLSETMKVNEEVYNVGKVVDDLDVSQNTQTFYFSIQEFKIPAFDKHEYFRFQANTIGILVLAKPINFDNMTRHWMMLNISVADGPSTASDTKYKTTEMNITVLDVDDQYPYFPHPVCDPKNCKVPRFKAVIKLDHTGPLQSTPVPMQAVDPDTLGTRLIYSIVGGDNVKGMFEISTTTGIVTQTSSVLQTGATESAFRLIIQVTKETHPNLFATAQLDVLVEERTPSYNGTVPGDVKIGASSEDSSSDLLIPLIILGVILAIIIVAVIIVFVVIRRKQKQMMVEPEGGKSEPQTEEEDLHTDADEYNTRTDSNEKLVFRGSAGTGQEQGGAFPDGFPATPNGRANQLPPLPLKDSATETMEGTKKKRSRRRNKNKEPEIYDGTREYNMGLDPEFFDSTDKAKVKRSHRSYDKKNDPALWIKVPNDNPPEEE